MRKRILTSVVLSLCILSLASCELPDFDTSSKSSSKASSNNSNSASKAELKIIAMPRSSDGYKLYSGTKDELVEELNGLGFENVDISIDEHSFDHPDRLVGYIYIKPSDPDAEWITEWTENASVLSDSTIVVSLNQSEIDRQNASNPSKSEKKEKQVVEFGNYNGEPIKWLVLESDGSTSFLISKDILDYKAFNDTTMATACSWEYSSLRKWLNSDFLTSAFTQNEQNAIQFTTVQDYESKDTPAGTTQDKVFLLSYEQAWSYFSSDSERQAVSKKYGSNSSEHYRDCWWLINTGSGSSLYKMLVNYQGRNENNPRVNEDEGVRPCIRVNSSYLS